MLVELSLLAPAVVLVALVFLAGVSAETGLLGSVGLAVVSVAGWWSTRRSRARSC